MSEDNMTKEDIAAGASGMVFDDHDKSEAEAAGEPPPAKKAAKKGARKRAKRAEKDAEISAHIELLERRLGEVEQKLSAHQIETHTCHMCHKGGATHQRGNTGEFYHGPCLVDFKNGKDPLPRP